MSENILDFLTTDYIQDNHNFLNNSILKNIIISILRPISFLKKIYKTVFHFKYGNFMAN